jgi:hypothetical protein
MASDGTLLILGENPSPGTQLAKWICEAKIKATFTVSWFFPTRPSEVVAWLEKHDIKVLNVAGPCEHSCLRIGDAPRHFSCGCSAAC